MATRPGIGGKTKRFSAATAAQQDASRSVTSTRATEREIKVADIVPDPRNRPMTKLTREELFNGIPDDDPLYALKSEFLDGLQELAQSIRVNDVLSPIKVYRHGGGYSLIYGERRWLASILAGKELILALIEERRPAKLRQVQAAENLQREDVLAGERLLALQDMVEEAEANGEGAIEGFEDLMRLTGKGRTQCWNYYQLLTAPEDVKDALLCGQIRTIKRALLVRQIDDPARRARAIETGEEGADGTLVATTPSASDSREEGGAATAAKKKGAGRRRTRVQLGALKPGEFEVLARIMSAVSGEDPQGVDWKDIDQVQAAWNQFLAELKD